METQTVVNIPFNKLVRSPKNVRVVNPDIAADRELIANVRANGVLQNLVVVPTETKDVYAFVAGGRRYSAVAHLVKQKVLPKTTPLPCLVRDADSATELSLSENLLRQAMHPADEFAAFQAMIDNGLTQADIAARFGISIRRVRMRLRLAGVAPALVAHYRAGSLTLDDMMAFTVSQDHDKQMQCYEALQGRVSAWTVRRYLTEAAARSDEAIAKFVTVKAYKRAGGAISTDLFQEATYLLNTELLAQMAEDKLGQEAKTVEAEGWKWIETSQEGPYRVPNLHRIDAKPIGVPDELEQQIEDVCVRRDKLEQLSDEEWDDKTEALCDQLDTEYERLEAEKDRYCAFTDEEKARAGAIVTFDDKGEIRVVRGLVREADIPAERSSNDASERVEKGSVSGALRRDLNAYRQQVIQAALAASPKVANDLLAFTICSQCVESLPRWEARLVSVSVEPTQYAAGRAFEETEAAKALTAAKDKLSVEWAAHDTPAARYEAFCALAAKAKAAWVAFAVASSTQAASPEDKDSVTGKAVDQLDIDVAMLWRPTGENYFKRLKGCDPLLDIGREWFGDVWVQKYRNEKKSVLVTRLHEAVNNAATRESLDVEVLKRIDAWLPEEIRD
mgnify:CR=1 FL=1